MDLLQIREMIFKGLKMAGITNFDFSNGSFIVSLDTNQVLHFDANFTAADGLDGTSDHSLDVNEMISSTANLQASWSYLFESSSNAGFTIDGGPHDTLVITRDDGTVAIIDEAQLTWYDRFTPTSDEGGTVDRMIDIDNIFANPGLQNYSPAPSITYPVYILEDSTGGGFNVTSGGYTSKFIITRDDGTVLTMGDPASQSTLADRFDLLGGNTSTADGVIDVEALAVNLQDSQNFGFTDSTGNSFTVSPGEGSTMIVVRDLGNGDTEQFLIESANLQTYSATTRAGSGETGEIDVSRLHEIAGSTNKVYEFYDSTGGDFSLSGGGAQVMMVHRDDGSVFSLDPYSTQTGTNVSGYDGMTTTASTGGVIDGRIDVAAIASNVNSSQIHEYYDSTGVGFTIVPGSNFSTVFRDNGEIYSFRPNTVNRDPADLYTTTGTTGGLNDNRIDIAAIAANYNISPGSYAYQWVGDPVVVTAPCFTTGTMIETSNGQVAVEDLKVGDKVRTKGNGMQEIRWIGSKRISSIEQIRNPKLQPVKITAGALGNNLPKQDLLVSRQHRMFVRSKIAKRMFDENEVLVAAHALTSMPGIYEDDSNKPFAYYHIAFDNHQVIFAEGAPTESLYLGFGALEAFDEEVAEELNMLFPELAKSIIPIDSARFIPDNKHQKALISRHIKNAHSVL